MLSAVLFSCRCTVPALSQSRPSELAVGRDGRVTTLRASSDLDGDIEPVPVLGGALSAHSKIDPLSGDLVSVSYSTALPPFLRHDVWDKDGQLKASDGIDTPIPIMVHSGHCNFILKHSTASGPINFQDNELNREF